MGSDRLAIRARVGLIIPSSNRLTEPQFHRYAPSGVQYHVTRLRMTGPHHVPLPDLVPRIVEAAQMLGDAKCDLVVFHCTSSSMQAGLAAEQQVVEAIQRATGRPAITTASAAVEAFRALEARRLALVTPYPHEVTVYLASDGSSGSSRRPARRPDTLLRGGDRYDNPGTGGRPTGRGTEV